MFDNHKNSVILLSYSGGDKLHSLAAWQSTFVEQGIQLTDDIEDRVDILFDQVCKTKKKTPMELLDMLASAGHHTPFEHSFLSFLITADIATHIQCLKHRIGVSINTESARYKELTENKFYIPQDWDMAYQEELARHNRESLDKYHAIIDILVDLGVSRSRAKESARYFLPYSTQLNFGMTFNFRSFMHFQSLRNSPHAQLEIRELAAQMLDQVRNIPSKPFELSLKAFNL
jgi:flavin-dependent thymidylate synthase